MFVPIHYVPSWILIFFEKWGEKETQGKTDLRKKTEEK